MREQVQGSVWDKVFKISERVHPYQRVIAGPLHFFVSYVLAMKSHILGAAGMDIGAVFTATAVECHHHDFIASFV